MCVYPTSVMCTGSSPLARGLHANCGEPCGLIRIIPARAGFTGGGWCWRWSCCGSSPLARGLLSFIVLVGGGCGIIPARAGFTTGGLRYSHGDWDHPRSRGVYDVSQCGPICQWGSSPLARGLLLILSSLRLGMGIIPARAGFTKPVAATRASPWDHPRSRGVYSIRDSMVTPPSGIIPARAGFTFLHSSCWGGGWDHPRSRGVY